MAALPKRFGSTLVFVLVLGILTDSSWGQDEEVIFIVEQPVEEGSVLKIVGNSSELGNGVIFDAPIMTREYDDVWNLTVMLAVGEAYVLNLGVDNCTCSSHEPYILDLQDEINNPVNLTGYFNCSSCSTPSPPPPSPSPPPPSPSPPPPSPPPPSPSPPPPSPSPPPPSPSPPPRSPPPPSPSPPPPSPPPPSPSPPPPSPPPPSPSPPPPSPPPPSPSPPPPSPPPPSPSPPPPSPPPPSPSPPPPSPPPPSPTPAPTPAPAPQTPEEVEVTFVFALLVDSGVLKVVGNASVLGNGNVHNAPNMTLTDGNVWVLTVPLIAGETYEVSLTVNNCYCTANDTYIFTVPTGKSHYTVPLDGFFNCTTCLGSDSSKSMMFTTIRGVVKMFSNFKHLV